MALVLQMYASPNSNINTILIDRIYLGAYDFHPPNTNDAVFFTIDDSLPYNPFHLDFGPLHIGHLYRFAVTLHNILNNDKNQGKSVVLYSATNSRDRANTACLLSCYMVLVQGWAPHQVLAPISQVDPPFMPFRDAGYSTADFTISIQDVVYSVWRAKERGMIDLTSFNLEEYELYERVEKGDFNVISKDFIAFASPKQLKYSNSEVIIEDENGLSSTFKHVLDYFKKNNVQLVVRLNSHLYDSSEFEKRGIKHIDMIFEDGTCPTMEIVQNFIGVSEAVIANGGKIAVHCKAGLGRTGCLIGAHLIYTHGFTANECIAYMRIIRPGMVVGPQQHWLYLHCNEFRDWKRTMVVSQIPNESLAGFSSLVKLDSNSKLASRSSSSTSLSDDESSDNGKITRLTTPPLKTPTHKIIDDIEIARSAVPLESPGQPRKSPVRSRKVSRIISNNGNTGIEDVHSPTKHNNVYTYNNSDYDRSDDEDFGIIDKNNKSPSVSRRKISPYAQDINEKENLDGTPSPKYHETRISTTGRKNAIPTSQRRKANLKTKNISNEEDDIKLVPKKRVGRAATSPIRIISRNGQKINVKQTRTTTTTTTTTVITSPPNEKIKSIKSSKVKSAASRTRGHKNAHSVDSSISPFLDHKIEDKISSRTRS